MKTLKDFKTNELLDKNAITVMGGTGCGTVTGGRNPDGSEWADWNDEGCCNT